MHKTIYEAFSGICANWNTSGAVLEIGAMPSGKSLLNMEALANAREKIGLNLDGPHDYADFHIVKGDVNRMDCFEDNRFDLVLCNAVLEHNPWFWKAIDEIKRVTRPGGLIVIGTPGYTITRTDRSFTGFFRNIPLVRKLRHNRYLNLLFTTTFTYKVHFGPGDYYRFSPDTYRDVFMEGLEEVSIRSLMLPPRIIGCGIKPGPAEVAES